jgi:hypothetical protein
MGDLPLRLLRGWPSWPTHLTRPSGRCSPRLHRLWDAALGSCQSGPNSPQLWPNGLGEARGAQLLQSPTR